jgi:zinc transport system ATP-binding protein
VSVVVRTRDLEFGYGRETSLEGVTIELTAGEAVAVVGPNGGGKTTLLKLLLGLLLPRSGDIEWVGGGTVGYVPQFAAFDRDFPLRLGEMILQGRIGRRGPLSGWHLEDRQAAQASLERLGLGPLGASYLSELSGGQIKRALIARALVSGPGVLIMDEPAASLDQSSRALLADLLREMKGRVTLIVATHEPSDFGFAFDRFLHVDRTVTAGTAAR